jgi:hypothetical protein
MKSNFGMKVSAAEAKAAGWDVKSEIEIEQFDSVAEALTAGHAATEADIMAGFNAQRRVKIGHGPVLDAIVEAAEKGQPLPTVETLRNIANGFTFKTREPADPNKPKAVSAKKAVESVKEKTLAALDSGAVKLSPAQLAAVKELIAKGGQL